MILSKTISRVMFLMIIYLDSMLPLNSSDLPKSRRAALCSLFGLASNGVYTASPVTRRAVVSYTAIPPLPFARRFIFCCTSLGVTSTGRYPASCPMKPGLSSPTAFRHCSCDHLFYSKSSVIITFIIKKVNRNHSKKYSLNSKTASTNKFSKKRIMRNILAANT